MQRSRKTIALVAAAAAGIGATTTAQAVTTNKPDVGSGKGYSRTAISFVFSVKEGIGNRGPSGSVDMVNPNYGESSQYRDRRGPVVCARIDGNRALIGFKDHLPGGGISYRQIYVEDHGNPITGHGVDRLAEVRSSSSRPDSDCGAFPARGTGKKIIAGNLSLTDRANGA